MPTPRFAALLAPLLLLVSGCADHHERTDVDAGTCGPMPTFSCVNRCGDDGVYFPECEGGEWGCPPGTLRADTCPPSSCGPSPGPECVCVGTTWSCDDRCPDDINPWDPTHPGNACAPEGRACTSGGDACGAAMFCTCESGRWNCAVAEPDPVCWCGREPSTGDRCSEEGATCGQCCPTADGPNWPAMQCSGGSWVPADCPEVVCPPVTPSCPVDTAAELGAFCGFDGQTCGNPCCGTAITCTDGVWRPGPEADCVCVEDPACGPGRCTRAQVCHSMCGPDDGIIYECTTLPDDCADCSCIEIEAWESCEMVDGVPHVSDGGFCG